MMDEERPSYFRLYADSWDEINRSLTKTQAAKLLYAMAAYFFDGTEPGEDELPKPVRALFNIQRGQIANYRRNALNGRKASQKVGKELSKSWQKPDQVSTQEIEQEIEEPFTTLPAETEKVGHRPPDKPPAKGPANINNHKSIIINEALADALLPAAELSIGVSQPHKGETRERLQVATGTETARANGAAPRGRAIALPSWQEVLAGGLSEPEREPEPAPDRAEYDRVTHMLEEGRYDELTDHDREIYHAGHKAYAALRL